MDYCYYRSTVFRQRGFSRVWFFLFLATCWAAATTVFAESTSASESSVPFEKCGAQLCSDACGDMNRFAVCGGYPDETVCKEKPSNMKVSETCQQCWDDCGAACLKTCGFRGYSALSENPQNWQCYAECFGYDLKTGALENWATLVAPRQSLITVSCVFALFLFLVDLLA